MGDQIQHEFLPDTWGRDQCDRRVVDDDGRLRMCGRRRRDHARPPTDTENVHSRNVSAGGREG